MADQHYHSPSSPGRAQRGFSEASISLSPFGGPGPDSALGQSSDLLGLPGPTSMSFGFASIPRTFSSAGDNLSGGPNTLYQSGIFLDSDADQQQQASDTSALRWPANYTLQPSTTTTTTTAAAAAATTNNNNNHNHNNTTAASAIPINRFQSEPQQSWSPLHIAPPLKTSDNTLYTRQRPAPRLGPNSRFPPGPGSDLVSRTNETDEGYYTHSQPDAQSVYSMGPGNFNQDRQNVQQRPRAAPSSYPLSGPVDGPEQPGLDMQPEQVNADAVDQSQPRATTLVCGYAGCGHESRTQSDFKKHENRHRRQHVCEVPDCKWGRGFATVNDLERHQKSCHKIEPEHGQSKDYKCFGDSCSKHEKVWPRLDNFKQHLVKMHRAEDPNMLLQKSNDWYKLRQQSEARPTVPAARRPPSSTSQQTRPRTAAQTGGHLSSQKQWNYQGLPNQGKGPHMRPPNRIVSSTYAQSEAGYYGMNVSGSSPSQARSRPSTGNTQVQSGPPPASCPHAKCSQRFMTLDHLKEHVQVEHGSQNVSTSHYRGTHAWYGSPSNQGSQSALSWGLSLPDQTFPGETAIGQALDQPQMRASNVVYGTRTAPGSIPALPYRLEEDFDNAAMLQSQDATLASGSPENILAQIGMVGDSLPSASDPRNLGPDTSPGQGSNGQEGRQTRQALQFSTDEVTKFLKDYASSISNDRIVTAIQTTVESLQSISSSGEVNRTPPSAAPALADVNFTRATREGKPVFVCAWSGCQRFKQRKCELRKHYQRHTQPWACTFDNCLNPGRPFGSKNDWKRHETKQHEQQEKWRCEEAESNTSGRSRPSTGDDACRKLFCTKDLYLKHLTDRHCISDSKLTNKLCKSQKIGAKCQGRYWCGFCNKIITMKSIGTDGDAERFNHIDHHFTKDHRPISQWKPLNGQPSSGDSTSPSGPPSPTGSSDVGSDSDDMDEDTSAEALATQGNKKRRASTMAAGSESGPPPKVARTGGSRVHPARIFLFNCCHCRNPFQSWNGSCTSCNHQVCRNCTTEEIPPTE